MEKIRTLFEVLAFPVVAMFAIGFGLLMAVAHLLGLPVLYLLEKRQERMPVKPVVSEQKTPPHRGRQRVRLLGRLLAIAPQRPTNSGK